MVSQVDEVRIIEDIGGQPKITYWTPDGRKIRAMPDTHEYSRTQNGKIVENGIRDANLDKGWLTSKPTILKLYCEACDRWHDTQEEVRNCIDANQKKRLEWEKKIQKKVEASDTQRIDRLEAMLSQLLERLGGK